MEVYDDLHYISFGVVVGRFVYVYMYRSDECVYVIATIVFGPLTSAGNFSWGDNFNAVDKTCILTSSVLYGVKYTSAKNLWCFVP